jgi:hypothetical protein
MPRRLLALLALLAAGCGPAPYLVQRRDARGVPSVIYLARDAVLYGVPCKGGVDTALDPAGRPVEGVLSRAFTLGGVYAPAGTRFYLYPGGAPRILIPPDGASLPVGGLRYVGELLFHEDGAVAKGELAAPQEHAGIPYQGALLFHKGGGVSEGELSRDATVKGLPLRGGTKVYFSEEGELRYGAHLAVDRLVGGVPARAGYVGLAAGGGVLEAVLSEDLAVQGLVLPAGSRAYFYEGGGLANGVPATPQRIQGLPARAGEYVQLHKNGRVASVFLAGEVSLQELRLARDQRVYFHESGRLSYGVLAEAATLRGVRYAKGAAVSLDEAGEARR